MKAIDASANIKDMEHVASSFVEVIHLSGAANVGQIVTSNAPSYNAAGMAIEAKHPHIFWTPWVVHSLNLALKSKRDPSEKSPQYTEWKYLKDLVAYVQDIRNFIVNHGMPLMNFKRLSKWEFIASDRDKVCFQYCCCG